MFKKVESTMNFVPIEEKILDFWKREQIFEKSIENRKDAPNYVFYEGPPTANGMPHAGHVLTRVVKDLIPRYKTMTGYRVDRKAGWDTHGLPVELEVEKQLGISGKPQIESYGVENFIKKCKNSVFTYEEEWRKMTERVGFWIDMDNPYVTYHNTYIESVWWALKQIWEKGLLYKGNKVVPYCPRCGTSLSSHEVAQGYKEVEDPSVFVKFPVAGKENTYFLVWTTTPWTLPSNVALAVKDTYTYVMVEQCGERLILAEGRLETLEGEYTIIDKFPGEKLVSLKYEPIFPFFEEEKDKAYYVVTADFVTLEDGTGIVHIAPAFGEDDSRVGHEYGLPVIQPVDAQGKFTEKVSPWAGMFVKDADKGIIKDLKSRNILYKSQKYKHSYPFCWRCDTPLLYYGRSSWFIKTTAIRERLLEINKGINWHPEHIRDGRFGNFLENVIDWCLSRERYWGTPLNIWICDECGCQHAVGSIKELKDMSKQPIEDIELHKPYVDEVILKCPECGGNMKRVPEVIDCWFDSGAMPFAQFHYPFENEDYFNKHFPADFISEAIDQTRGWFYSLLVISTLLFDKSPYKNVLVMGHILDEKGIKMSKHKGNILDPWKVLNEQGADAMRWYLYVASPPWSPSRFYQDAVSEAQRRFLGTLWNVYSFFILYANIDEFDPRKYSLDPEDRSELDRWLLSRINSVNKQIRKYMNDLDITDAARTMESLIDDISNWYVRRCRERYWKSEMDNDKIAAYLTLYEALVTFIKMAAPFVPFITEELYQNLVLTPYPEEPASIHLCDFPEVKEEFIDEILEHKMELARKIVELGRAARNKGKIKNRQPLQKMMVQLRNFNDRALVLDLSDIIKEELNIKEIEYIDVAEEYFTYMVKPRFDLLGPKYGKLMSGIAKEIAAAEPMELIKRARENGQVVINVNGENITILENELDIRAQDKEGFCAEGEGGYYVVLDTTITPDLMLEGFARELVSKIQNMRKEAGFKVEDKICLYYLGDDIIDEVLEKHGEEIKTDTLSIAIERVFPPEDSFARECDINGHKVNIGVKQI
ncbi:Isoleucine--tRNA ligase [Tepidanaerobacter acetatoxydans Re1]|uniref:Isoleucine--tRNA ligase n=1 Tax=Tepidanaerobacter acetatoxydans (strain DSM 21804 / JCM 16047 / Re1) TaxID=1209989 RepID=F4LW95_TEPAE|nr:isoleucine--tRNA ligase [Tepidanaerobacter acetatoxydans]AEE90871.1 Isoleucyl-tRNA synthetase [Tepidanaerobacter acetatoxydans Re1]CCP25437.1 Isoleucine--tRNA ligase [Tepidanaerobacter acetatoxydans Re1]